MSSTFMPGRTPRNSSISAGFRPGSSLRSAASRSDAATTAAAVARASGAAAAVGAGAGADLHAAAQAKRRTMRFIGGSFREERVLQYPDVQRHPGLVHAVTLPWYVEFFRSGDYARLYSFERERSAREAAFAVRALGLSRGARVLDLCCGCGRHLRELPGAVGVDLDLASLRGLPAACADMRALPLRSGSVDGVVSLFSSFGYLESDEEDA